MSKKNKPLSNRDGEVPVNTPEDGDANYRVGYRHPPLETRFQSVLQDKTRAVRQMLASLSRHGAVQIDTREVEPTATSMVVVLTYWLSFEYVRDPRHALEPDHAQQSLLRGAGHVLHLLAPYLEPEQRRHLITLMEAYQR